MSRLGPLPPLFPQPPAVGAEETGRRSMAGEAPANLDEYGRPLKPLADVIASLPGLSTVIRSPMYLGVHSIASGEVIQVDNGASTSANLQLELTGEVLRDGSNTLCLHMKSAIQPPRPAAGAGRRPGSSRRSRPGPLSMADLLGELPTGGPLPGELASGGAGEPAPAGSEEPDDHVRVQHLADAIMITGQVHRIAPGASVPAPNQPLPGCFRTHFIGPYRVRLLRLELQDPASSATTPGRASPDSTLPDHASIRPGFGSAMGGALEDLAPPTVLAHVAVDCVQSHLLWSCPLGDLSITKGNAWQPTQEPAGFTGTRSLHLDPGESCSLWLTTQSKAQQQISFGPAEDGFTVALHTKPLPHSRDEASVASPALPLDPDDPGDPGAIGPVVYEQSQACGEDEAVDGHTCWEAELDMLRCGEVEATQTVQLFGGTNKQTHTEEDDKPRSAVVGDYRVTVLREAAPMCRAGEATSAAEKPNGIYCEYPMLLMHVEVRVERLTEDEVDDGGAGAFSFLDAL